MQCEICKINTATIHLTEIVEGVRTEMHICEKCAIEQGIAVKSQIPLKELLSNLLSSQPSEEELAAGLEEKKVCPECGWTMEDFRKHGLLGCPADYEVFEQDLLPLIEKAHSGKTVHHGKIPSRMPAKTKDRIKLSNLKQQLQQAVREENYELAASLRDQINQLTGHEGPQE